MSSNSVRRQLLLLLAALIFLCRPAAAHEIPVSATLQMFVKPEGQTLKVLVRVPLTTYVDGEYPRRPGDYVDLAKVDPSLRAAATITVVQPLKMYEGERALPEPRIVSTRLSLDSDRSFADYKSALAHVTGPPLPQETNIFWEQAKLDMLLEYPIRSDRSSFAMHAAFDRLAENLATAVQFIAPGGITRIYDLHGDAGLVKLNPSWTHAAWLFVKMGFHHILEGTDHLLFLFCLVIPFRRVRPLIPIVTAFTVAHSITLIASAYGLAPDALWFPPLIETLIALSIVYMALENIIVEQPARRWIITFFFGLVHGFGFSFVLRETLQFAGDHILSSLLAFNVGVEIGQLVMLLLFVPLLNLLFSRVVARRLGTIILSALVAHQAWHWMEDRFDALSQFPWPAITASGVLDALRWVTALVVLAALVWLVSLLMRRREQARGLSGQ
ncbi:HupE/UreJ family protein [Sphingomonas quercus]|uniref:HupE/UreJ family protein n=1 Tax=Sphingomonas quercus TaxID=2842451 RepID=A0ABS6BEP0_9SPHN|nr:HupE/UreJ family protein [Sphingomonas quercus]MBU3076775.1 HupE/UreJ family protein [Sphingomonas quercus]